MTNITYNRNTLTVTVEGHANYGTPGCDIVCASVSMLITTLGLYAEKLEEYNKLLVPPVIQLDSGNSRVDVTVMGKFDKEATAVFDAVCDGFKLLSETYPNNVWYRELH